MRTPTLTLFLLISLISYAQESFENIKSKGYQNYTSYTQMIGSQKDHNTYINAIEMDHNYLLSKNFAFGVSTGIEWMDINMVSIGPNIKMSLPGFNKKSVFVSASYGAVIPLEKVKNEWYETSNTKGKHFFNSELGYIFPANGSVAFFIAMGYRYQSYSYTRNDWWRTSIDRQVKYNRFILKLGIRLF